MQKGEPTSDCVVDETRSALDKLPSYVSCIFVALLDWLNMVDQLKAYTFSPLHVSRSEFNEWSVHEH